jgi:two-component system, NarL family, sensor histidine kinase UhpB
MDTARPVRDARSVTEVVDRPSREPAHGDGPPTPMRALFWRLFVGNGLVFAAGAAVLVLSPATVSEPVTSTEIGVLAVGLALMLALNAALTHAALPTSSR